LSIPVLAPVSWFLILRSSLSAASARSPAARTASASMPSASERFISTRARAIR
jgi:hypothetical protein